MTNVQLENLGLVEMSLEEMINVEGGSWADFWNGVLTGLGIALIVLLI